MGLYKVFFHDSGIPKTGLTPDWESLKDTDGNNITPEPTITEIGGGWYKYTQVVPLDKQYVGVIDGGAGVVLNIDRYVPIDMNPHDFDLDNMEEIFISPSYDEDTDTLTMIIFLLRDGKLVSSGITNVDVTVYDSSHVSKFTLSGVSGSGGVYIGTKSAPGLVKNRGYYAKAVFTEAAGNIISVDCMIALE